MKNKLAEIADAIIFHRVNVEPTNCGLLAGNMGEIIFLYYYSQLENKYSQIADSLLEQTIDFISNSEKSALYSYCSGLAGFGVGLHLLEDQSFIENSLDVLDDIDIILSHQLEHELSISNYDFLHGALGIGFYFLRQYHNRPEISKLGLSKILTYFAHTVEKNDQTNCSKWVKIDFLRNNTVTYNISLSHGISSIIIFLSQVMNSKIFASDPAENSIKNMLNEAVNYILSQQLDPIEHGSYFPSTSLEDSRFINLLNKKSRLSWCYGDLGIAIALKHASYCLGRNDIKLLANNILLFSTKRKDFNTTYIHDAQICHGSAGVSQIFYRSFLDTQDPVYFEAYKYWRAKTIESSSFEDGLAGYRFYSDFSKTWVKSTSLLDGIAGVGLSLISEFNPNWDEILLLNFKHPQINNA